MISETFILNQITGLIDLGHEVDIFPRRPSADRAVRPEVERYGLLARTHWFDLPRTRW
jgi:colanic acid/amylovoran biosynthesis glycosyltransferase